VLSVGKSQYVVPGDVKLGLYILNKFKLLTFMAIAAHHYSTAFSFKEAISSILLKFGVIHNHENVLGTIYIYIPMKMRLCVGQDNVIYRFLMAPFTAWILECTPSITLLICCSVITSRAVVLNGGPEGATGKSRKIGGHGNC
jgi:hypothetical protein